jgi:hypothetical protein
MHTVFKNSTTLYQQRAISAIPEHPVTNPHHYLANKGGDDGDPLSPLWSVCGPAVDLVINTINIVLQRRKDGKEIDLIFGPWAFISEKKYSLSDDVYSALTNFLVEVGRYAEYSRVPLAISFLSPPFDCVIRDPFTLLKIVTKVGIPYVGAYLDEGHCVRSGFELKEAQEILGSKLFHSVYRVPAQ